MILDKHWFAVLAVRLIPDVVHLDGLEQLHHMAGILFIDVGFAHVPGYIFLDLIPEFWPWLR